VYAIFLIIKTIKRDVGEYREVELTVIPLKGSVKRRHENRYRYTL